jgi:hypothetical protein
VVNDRTLTAQTVGRLPEAPKGWYDVAYALSASGNLTLLRCDFDVRGNNTRREDVFGPWQQIPLDARDRLSVFDGKVECCAIEFEYEGQVSVFDMFSDGRWIVASGRSRPDELKARVFSPQGELLRRFGVGDAIGHLQCDSAGAVWVGYFDEAGGEEFGLIKFDDHGKILWRADSNKAGLLDILDCYALNVGGDSVWAYYYTDFPVVDVDASGRTRVRKCPIAGAEALAVDGQAALLAGGYDGNRNRIVLLELDEYCARVVEQFRIDFVPAFDRARPWLLDARGNAVHVVEKGVWRRLSVSDVRAHVSATTAD